MPFLVNAKRGKAEVNLQHNNNVAICNIVVAICNIALQFATCDKLQIISITCFKFKHINIESNMPSKKMSNWKKEEEEILRECIDEGMHPKQIQETRFPKYTY